MFSQGPKQNIHRGSLNGIRTTETQEKLSKAIRNISEDIFKEVGIAEGYLRVNPDTRYENGLRVVISNTVRETKEKGVDAQKTSDNEWRTYSALVQSALVSKLQAIVIPLPTISVGVYGPERKIKKSDYELNEEGGVYDEELQEYFVDKPRESRVRISSVPTAPKSEVSTQPGKATSRDQLVKDYGTQILNVEYPRLKKALSEIKQGVSKELETVSESVQSRVRLLAYLLDGVLNEKMAESRRGDANLSKILRSNEVDPLNRILKLTVGKNITLQQKERAEADLSILKSGILKDVDESSFESLWEQSGEHFVLKEKTFAERFPILLAYQRNEDTYWAMRRLAPLVLKRGTSLPGGVYSVGLLDNVKAEDRDYSDLVTLLIGAVEGRGVVTIDVKSSKGETQKSIDILPLLTKEFGISLPETDEEVSRKLAEFRESSQRKQERGVLAETPEREVIKRHSERLEAIRSGALTILEQVLKNAGKGPEIALSEELSTRSILLRELRILEAQIDESRRDVDAVNIKDESFEALYRELNATIRDFLQKAEALPEPRTLSVELEELPSPSKQEKGSKQPKNTKDYRKTTIAEKEPFSFFKDEELIRTANALYKQLVEDVVLHGRALDEAAREFIEFTNEHLSGEGQDGIRSEVMKEVESLRGFSIDAVSLSNPSRMNDLIGAFKEWLEIHRPAVLKGWQLGLGYVMIVTLATAIKVELEKRFGMPLDSAVTQIAAVLGGFLFATIDIVGTKTMLDRLQRGVEGKPLTTAGVVVGFASGAALIAAILSGTLQGMNANSAQAGTKIQALEAASIKVKDSKQEASAKTAAATTSYSAAMSAFTGAVVATEKRDAAALAQFQKELAAAGFPEYTSSGLGSSAGEGFGPNARAKLFAFTGKKQPLDDQFKAVEANSNQQIEKIRRLRAEAGLQEGETYGDAVKRTINDFIQENPYAELDTVLRDIDDTATNLRKQDTFVNAVIAMLAHKELITSTGLELLAKEARVAGVPALERLEELANRLRALEEGMKRVAAEVDPSIKIPSFNRDVLSVNFNDLSTIQLGESSSKGHHSLPVVSMDAARIIAAYEAKKKFPNDDQEAERLRYQEEVEQRNIAVTFAQALVIELGAFFAGLAIIYAGGGRRRHRQATKDIPVLAERLSNTSHLLTSYINALRRRYLPSMPEIPEHMVVRVIADTMAARERSLKLPDDRTALGATAHVVYEEFLGMLVTPEMRQATVALNEVTRLGQATPQSLAAARHCLEELMPGITRLVEGNPSNNDRFPDSIIESHLVRRIEYLKSHEATLLEARERYVSSLGQSNPEIIRSLQALDAWKEGEMLGGVEDAIRILAAYDRALHEVRSDYEQAFDDLTTRAVLIKKTSNVVTIPTTWASSKKPPSPLSVEALMISSAVADMEGRKESINPKEVLGEYQRILAAVGSSVQSLREAYGDTYTIELDQRLYTGKSMVSALRLTITPRADGERSFVFMRELAPSDTAERISEELRAFVENNISFEYAVLKRFEESMEKIQQSYQDYTIEFDYTRLFGERADRTTNITLTTPERKVLLDTRVRVKGDVLDQEGGPLDSISAEQVADTIAIQIQGFIRSAVERDVGIRDTLQQFMSDFLSENKMSTLSITYTPDTKGSPRTEFMYEVISGEKKHEGSFILENPTKEYIVADLRRGLRAGFEKGVRVTSAVSELREEFKDLVSVEGRNVDTLEIDLVSQGSLKQEDALFAVGQFYDDVRMAYIKKQTDSILETFAKSGNDTDARNALTMLRNQIANTDTFISRLGLPPRQEVGKRLQIVRENSPFKREYDMSVVFPQKPRQDTGTLTPYLHVVRRGSFFRKAEPFDIDLGNVTQESLTRFKQ